jgi:hypothetical protein
MQVHCGALELTSWQNLGNLGDFLVTPTTSIHSTDWIKIACQRLRYIDASTYHFEYLEISHPSSVFFIRGSANRRLETGTGDREVCQEVNWKLMDFDPHFDRSPGGSTNKRVSPASFFVLFPPLALN